MNTSSWKIKVSEDGERLYVRRGDKEGEIQIHLVDEGIVIDVWGKGQDEPIASTYAYYNELEGE